MQNYNKIQKFISFLLIFSILFSFTINVKFFSFVGTIFASDTKYYNLVSIFVEEEIYSDIKSEINTYAKNIQNTNENTKAIIIPTSRDEAPFNIASVNEKLFFEGEGGIFGTKGNSKLVGTVFVGDLSLPVVEKDGSYEKTVYPYVDFQDKLYIYNNEKKIYQENKDLVANPKAEIFHGFISPNTGDEDEDIKAIKDYFAKNNDYYEGKGNFKNIEGITNGKEDETLVDKYEPYVFYYDQIRESKAVKYVDYKAYQTYLDNLEDIFYARYSKELADKLTEKYYGPQNDFLKEVKDIVGTGVSLGNTLSGVLTKNVPDIQTRTIIQKATKNFINMFNEATLGEFRKDVHNAGRYNKSGDRVNVDFIPYLVSNMDILSQNVIKNVNNDLEKNIDNLVKNGLSRDIGIIDTYLPNKKVFTNFLYGQKVSDFTTASGCTIYRGSLDNSGSLVEANRAFNFNNALEDAKLCKDKTYGYWGGNSPVNIDGENIKNGGDLWVLKNKNTKNAIKPLFDLGGAIKNTGALNTPSPNNCFDTNLLQTTPSDHINCSAENKKLDFKYTFDYVHKNFPLEADPCQIQELNLSGQNIKSYNSTYNLIGDACNIAQSVTDELGNSSIIMVPDRPLVSRIFNYKKIKSWIEHKSPTSEDLSVQIKSMIANSLPIDKDRYIDFIAADNTYAKINYPYLFRITLDSEKEFDLDNAKIQLKKVLDKKSSEINEIIKLKDPSKLSKADAEIYKLLKTGEYPKAEVDLYKELENKPEQEIEILGAKKKLHYLDMLIFSLYWNNLNSVGAKYKFVMENYLSDQFGGNDFKFFLPKNKKQYEMSYIGAPGDAQNMYIKLDPEDKGENPYESIISQNSVLNGFLLGNKGNTNSSGNFKCAPPEGVPIWKWIPAVMCRLKDMLPPKISITDQSCGLNLIKTDKNGNSGDDSDLNKNGISDFLEKEIGNGTIKIKTDANKYFYNSMGNLEANLLNASGGIVYFDNLSSVKFELLKVEGAINPKLKFTPDNKKVIYDKTLSGSELGSAEAYKEAGNYVGFKDLSIVTKEGIAKYSFATKANDADVTFRATLTLKDQKGNIIIKKEDTKSIEIRGDVFYGTSYKLGRFLNNTNLEAGDNSVVASNSNNIYLVQNKNFETIKNSLSNLSTLSNSKEKLFISLSNTDKANNDLPINYPLVVRLTDNKGKEIKKEVITSEFTSPISLGSYKVSGTYNLEIKDKFGASIKKEIEIMPDEAVKIEPKLSTNLVENNGVITTNVFTIYDQYGNPTIGDTYKVEAKISGGSLTFEDGNDFTNYFVIEGYKPFRLKTTSSTGNSSISFRLKKDDKLINEVIQNVAVVDNINFEITGLPNDIKVGYNEYNYKIDVKNAPDGFKFNSRAYLISNNLYITPNEEYIDLVNNSGSGGFKTTLKASEETKLEFKIEGVRNSVFKNISILPDLPIKVDLSLSKSKIEADKNVKSNLYVELKDQYNNVVWNDNKTELKLTIHPKYTHIIKSNQKDLVSKKGKQTFILQGTNIPGTAYFMVSTNPNLSQNKVEFVGQSEFKKQKLDSIPTMRDGGLLTELGRNFFEEYDLDNYRFKIYDKTILKSNEVFRTLDKETQDKLLKLFDEQNKIIITGVGENAGKIETFYFWNKSKINGRKYNSIYTTLLGSNYGDITIKDNLANSIIFDKNNRSLAVTSLLNNLDKELEVVNINPNGNVILSPNSTNDLSQDISVLFNSSNNGNLELSFFNNTFSSLAGKVEYNLIDSTFKNCNLIDLNNCLNQDKNIVGIKLLDNNYISEINESQGIVLKDSNNSNILSFGKDGKLLKNPFVNFEINSNYKNGFVADIKVNGKIIGLIGIKLSSKSKVDFIRDISLTKTVANSQEDGGLIIYIESKDYYLNQKYSGASTKNNVGYVINYNDPFASNSKTLNSFSDGIGKGYESFSNEKGIGWEEDNKTLLSFAAGKNVGESTKDYMSFSLINIGDPLISLKKINKKLPGTPQNRKFDSSIGYLISKDENNQGYTTFDYNKDDITDIAILKGNGYIELLEGTNDIKNFVNKGNLVYISDLGSKSTLQSGDFNGDGYEDLVLLNKNRLPILLNNNNKDFTRIDLALGLKGIISQIISYDMDLDGKSDLITFDDSGEINIHYGTKIAGNFDKLKVDSGLGINLGTGTRSDMGALYYDGLYQLPETKQDQYIKESEELLKGFNRNNPQATPSQDNFNEDLVDKLIFTQINYGFKEINISDSKNELIKNLPNLETLNLGGEASDNNDIKDFVNNTSEELNPGKNFYELNPTEKLTTFIKSEYAESQGVKIEKKYNDENGFPLKGGDKIKLDIKITNTTSSVLNNIAYADKIPEPFKLGSNPNFILNIAGNEINSKDIIVKNPTSNEYNILIDSYKNNSSETKLSLKPGDSIYFSLTLDTNVFEYGYIEAGIFDDETKHGDIVFKNKDENCGKEYNLYKSTNVRDYSKKVSTGVCKTKLPGELEKNAKDDDNNGVPDYIDSIVSNTGSQLDYAKEKINEIYKDTDGDGKVDNEEMSPDRNDDDDFMGQLGYLEDNVDKITSGIDKFLAGLTCGFGGPGCIGMPINAAPLAPGSSISLFGFPVAPAGISQHGVAYSGLPVFSALAWLPTPVGPLPMPWPPAFIGAGGILLESGINFFRLFVTPTITGAVGIAACFGPAYMSYIWAPGVWPTLPLGNCVAVGVPLFGCKNDGSDGYMSNMGIKSKGSSLMNGNCDSTQTNKTPYIGEVAREYLNYKRTGNKSQDLKNNLKDALSTVARRGGRWEMPQGPLMTMGGVGEGDFTLDVDFGALKSGNYEDVVKIQMKRISPFPDFLMDWVQRQIEEIVNKIFDFPTLNIILPDMSGIYDNRYKNFFSNIQNSFNSGSNSLSKERESLQNNIDKLEKDKSSMKCDGENLDAETQLRCYVKEADILKEKGKKDIGNHSYVGGVKSAYQFISNLPMISIQSQKVYYNIPWIDSKTADRAINDFKLAQAQRQQEYERAKQMWDLENYTSIGNNDSTGPDGNRRKILADTRALIESINKNIETINDYKRFPQKIHKMIKIKEIRINQILCNIETISKITGGRIGDNGKRFKAWVELYMLIKAVLKSWQLLIDIFLDFSAECHACKNERYDLMYFIWKLISFIIPKIPIIQFPKWPDLYLDLHNIRLQINIGLPEYEFNFRPIIIPPLPRLYLPDSPNVNISLPKLPLLPRIQLMDLPDLPVLPKVELPNLPPPPKIPKLLGSIQGVLKILKLVTKLQCFLKTSILVPEWRVGDQIAYITERPGYLGIDFLDIALGQFGLPFIDAIKVTTFVNLEMDVEFLVEMSRQTAMPLNSFGNNIANTVNIGLGDLDFRDALPLQDVNVKVKGDDGVKSTPDNIFVNPNPLRESSFKIDKNSKSITLYQIVGIIGLNILKLHNEINNQSKVSLNNEQFKKDISKQLPNLGNSKLVGVWENTLNYSFNKEDKLISELIKNNDEKFNEVKSILLEEKEKFNKKMGVIEGYFYNGLPNSVTLISSSNNKIDYNSRLDKYNYKTLEAINNITSGKEDYEVTEIKKESKDILQKVQTGLNEYGSKLQEAKIGINNDLTNFSKNNLLANNTIPVNTLSNTNLTPLQKYNGVSSNLLANNTTPTQPTSTPQSSNCSEGVGGYSYIYKGIYVIEKFINKDISYLLFDYIDELVGNEKFSENDLDGDGDKDAIYMVGNEIYIKENLLSKKIKKEFYTGNPLVLDISDNKFYSGDFIESVNGFKESSNDSGFVNINFSEAYNNISGYNIEFYELVDKFNDVNDGFKENYTPKKVKKHIFDAFRDIDNITSSLENSENFGYRVNKNLAYINNVGNLFGVKLTTKELKNLKDDINKNKEIIINSNTKIYSASDDLKLTYYLYKDKSNDLKLKTVSINNYSNISFNDDIVIVGVSSDTFVEGKGNVELIGNSIISYVKKPLLPGATIEMPADNEVSQNQYLNIKYFDGSNTTIDNQYAKYYSLYDLGDISDDYLVRTSIENNFYYAKIRSFKAGKYSTNSNQIVLSPQKESDNRSPELTNMPDIKIPVYQKKTIDITNYIFEESGIKNIKNIYVDFDLNIDKNSDGDVSNDKDFELGKSNGTFDISIESNKVYLTLGKFDNLYNKQIRIYIVDANNNVGYKDIGFNVYSPTPSIQNIKLGNVLGYINESLIDEPISIYRVRNGNIDRLKDISGKDITNTIEKGNYNFQTDTKIKGGLEFSYSGSKIFTINEETGKIEISDFEKTKENITYKVYDSSFKSNLGSHVRIEVLKSGNPIYYQYIKTPDTQKVEVVDDFKNISNIGTYFKPIDNNFEYVSLPLGIKNNSGDLFIYPIGDVKQSPIVKIYKDGRIEVLSSDYILEYDSFGNYVVFNIKNTKSNSIIGKVMLIPEKNYIIK